MNPQYPITDEVLSAFLDGELAEKERKQVEVWLESSADARRQLDDLRQIGTLVRSIPVPALPDGFQPAVMQRLKQEAVESIARPQSAAAASPSPNGRALPNDRTNTSKQTNESIKRWMGGLVSLAAAMGVILALGIFLQNQPADRGGLARDANEAEPTVPVSHETDDDAVAMGGGADAMRDQESFPEPALPPSMAPRSVDGAGDLPPPESVATESVAADSDADRGFPPNGQTLAEWLESRPDPTIPLTPGEVMTILNQIGGQAVVVEFVVVDVTAVDNTSNQLEVLLIANGIRPVSDYGYGVAVDPEAIHFEEGEQVLIYIEADEATIATALEQMEEFDEVVNVGVNYLASNDVADGNVRDPLYDLLDQVGEGYGIDPLIAQQTAPAPGNSAIDAQAPQEGNTGAAADATTAEPGDAPQDPAPSRTVEQDAGEPPAEGTPGSREMGNLYVTQRNVSPDVLQGLETQQILNNSVITSQNRQQARDIADNRDQTQQPAETEVADDESVADLPVKVIIVVRSQGPLPASPVVP